MHLFDLLIVGAGPSGLSAAIAARQAGLDYAVLEKGVLVNSIFNFPRQMVFFTTPDLLEIGGLPFVTPYDKPTRHEALRYYRRVVDTCQLEILMDEQVTHIGRESLTTLLGAAVTSPEPIFSVDSLSGRGVRRTRHARAVVLAIGYYDHPNLLNVPGEDLPHVTHYYTEPHGYYRKTVVIVGARNSGAETALELYRAGADVTLVHRGAALGETIKYWVRPDIENRIKEGSIRAMFSTRVIRILPTSVLVEHSGSRQELPADAVLLMTGYMPDIEFIRSAGVDVDPVTCTPRFNPETLETNVPNLFLAGGAVCGRDTSAIFIENGRFHGEKIVEVLKRRRLGSADA
jgi:thioredoxin reductase (NADPH)